jgi:hypothetical protein
MVDPGTQVEITNAPKSTHIDFFVVIIVFSFLFEDWSSLIRKGHLRNGKKERPQRNIQIPWGLHIGFFWNLVSIGHPRRLEVAL